MRAETLYHNVALIFFKNEKYVNIQVYIVFLMRIKEFTHSEFLGVTIMKKNTVKNC
jgi:hypothetical protein